MPFIVSVNCNEELLVLANACYPSLHIPPQTTIAIAIALPMWTMDQMPPRCYLVATENPEVCWVQHISRDRPIVICQLSNNGVQIDIKGMIDTGADVSIVSYYRWPTNWKLIHPSGVITGIRSVTSCLQSESMIIDTGPGNKKALIRPCIVQKPVMVWGRDLLSQWGAKIELDFSQGPLRYSIL